MDELTNQQINLARRLCLKNDYRSALTVLQQVQKRVYQTVDYPYLHALDDMMGQVEARVSAVEKGELALQIEGMPDPTRLSPELLAHQVSPFVQALESLQRQISGFLDLPAGSVQVQLLEKSGALRLEIEGAALAAHATHKVIAPWRQQNSSERSAWYADRSHCADQIQRACDEIALELLAGLAKLAAVRRSGQNRRKTTGPPEIEWITAVRQMSAPLETLLFGSVSVLP